MSPMKGIRRILSFHQFHGSRTTASPSSLSPSPSQSPTQASSSAPTSPKAVSSGSDITNAMFENISRAEPIIIEWNLADPEVTTASDEYSSLFHEKNREKARLFLDSVSDVNHSMHYFSASQASSRHQVLVRGQRLMETAMKRLQKEFFQILSSIRDRIDSNINTIPPSDRAGDVSPSSTKDGAAIAMADLRAVAECMVSSGYSKECVRVYQILRRSVIEEGIYNLGFHRINQSQLQKLDSEAVQHRIKSWLAAARPIIQTIFSREKLLCDYVFGNCSLLIAESCFAEISRDPALHFFEFPELIVNVEKTKATKRSPEKIDGHNLDLYNSISTLLPDIQSVFAYRNTSTVLTQVITSLNKLGESVQNSPPHITTVENAIHVNLAAQQV